MNAPKTDPKSRAGQRSKSAPSKFSFTSALNYLHRLARRTVVLARHRRAPAWLGGLSAAESVFFPLPVDPLLAAMVAARTSRAIRYATICTAGSVLGGIIGYWIGSGLIGPLVHKLVEFLGQEEKFGVALSSIADNGALWIFVVGFTPIPYKLLTLGSGMVGINFGLFVAVSILARGLRFFLVALIMKWLGPIGRYWLQKYFGRLTVAVCVLILLLVLVYNQFAPHLAPHVAS